MTSIWPVKPYPEDKLPLAVLTTAYQGSAARLRALCRRFLFAGCKIPDEVIADFKKIKPGDPRRLSHQHFPPIDFTTYNADDPISILQLLLELFVRDQNLYLPGRGGVMLSRGGRGSSVESNLNIPKDLIIACLEKDTRKTLSFFYPSQNEIIDIVSTNYGNNAYHNKDFLSYLVIEGAKINPTDVILMLFCVWNLLDLDASEGLIDRLGWRLLNAGVSPVSGTGNIINARARELIQEEENRWDL